MLKTLYRATTFSAISVRPDSTGTESAFTIGELKLAHASQSQLMRSHFASCVFAHSLPKRGGVREGGGRVAQVRESRPFLPANFAPQVVGVRIQATFVKLVGNATLP